ncbi:MAG: hypothetical protein IJU98_03365 [Synergistaceae bacterium]|nr:hypothetical protein [Synergistaceae bacterium]
MKLSQEGLTSWGCKYEWVFGGGVALYYDATDADCRLITYLNTRSGLPFENEYMDEKPAVLSSAERKEWDALCCGFLATEQNIYSRIVDELRWYVGEQVKDMRSENPDKRVISSDEYDLLYAGARDAVASTLHVPDEDVDILNYEEGANILDLWLGDLLESEGYTLEG